MSAESGDVTRLLKAWSDGDARALPELMPLVVDEEVVVLLLAACEDRLEKVRDLCSMACIFRVFLLE